MRFRFPIVIIDEDYRTENTSGFGIRALAEAIKEEGKFDLILSDYHLGLSEENGLKLLEAARNLQSDPLPISILITGDTTIELIKEASKSDVKLLHKPIKPARLRLLLNNLFTSANENISTLVERQIF